MSTNVSAVLLATATAVYRLEGEMSASLSGEQKAKLKKALEISGAMIAVTGGDYLGIYDKPGLAITAAMAFQAAVEEMLTPAGVAFTGRVVLEVWPAGVEQMPVGRVHEIMEHTHEGCVLVSPNFIEHLNKEQMLHLMPAAGSDAIAVLKGVREYHWKGADITHREQTRLVKAQQVAEQYISVTVTRRDHEATVLPKDCPFSIGRDATCSLSVGGSSVSRFHGELQYENGKFYYRDLSRNGSYLTAGGQEVYLQQERCPLVGKGLVSPGAPLVEQTGDVIKFRCNCG